MILFLYYLKFKAYLLDFKNPWKILIYVILIFITTCSALACSGLIDVLSTNHIANLTPLRFIGYLQLFIVSITLMRMILPSYQPYRRPFPAYYPISNIQHYMTSVIADFMKPFFFFTTLFIFIVSFTTKDQNISFFISGITILVTTQFLRRLIQYPIDFQLTWPGYILCLTGIGTLIIIPANLFKFNNVGLYYLIEMIVFVVIGYFIEINLLENRKVEFITPGNRSIYIKLILNNKKAAIPLFVGLALKTCFLTFDIYSIRNTGNHLIDERFIYWIFASPLILFTYVFNNLWGFWTSLYLTFETRSGDYKDLFKCAIKIILPVIAVDCLISIPLLLATWNDYLFLIVFYFSSALILTALSALWSCIFPVRINSTFQIKGSVSFISYLISMSAVLLLASIRLNPIFYILVPLFIILATLVYKHSLKTYKAHKYNLYDKVS